MADPNYEYIGDGRPDGTVVFRSSATVTSANALGAFFGAAPRTRPSAVTSVSTAAIASVSTAAIASVATAAVASSAGVYGYGTAAQGDGVITAINAIVTRADVLTTAVNAAIVRAGVLTTEGNALVTALSSASGLGLIA